MNWKKDLDNVLRESFGLILQGRGHEIKKSIEKIVHSIVLTQEKVLIETFITFYSLGKLLERVKYKRDARINVDEVAEKILSLINLLRENNLKMYLEKISEIKEIIKEFEKKSPEYAKNIENKAKLKLSYHLHRHGLSIKKVSNLLEISEIEIQNYLGFHDLFEEEESVEKVKKRIKYFEEFLEK